MPSIKYLLSTLLSDPQVLLPQVVFPTACSFTIHLYIFLIFWGFTDSSHSYLYSHPLLCLFFKCSQALGIIKTRYSETNLDTLSTSCLTYLHPAIGASPIFQLSSGYFLCALWPQTLLSTLVGGVRWNFGHQRNYLNWTDERRQDGSNSHWMQLTGQVAIKCKVYTSAGTTAAREAGWNW